MKSQPYTGKVSGMKTSPWLASEDLSDGDGKFTTRKVKISGVFRNNDVVLDAGRKEKELFSVAFEGVPKQMILNATNRKTLAAEFGNDTRKWIGCEIALTVETGVRMAGKLVTGLRFVGKKTAKARDLNAEIGISESSTESPAMKAKPQPASTPASEVDEEEIDPEDLNHGDD